VPRYLPAAASAGVLTVSQKRRATLAGICTEPLGMINRGRILYTEPCIVTRLMRYETKPTSIADAGIVPAGPVRSLTATWTSPSSRSGIRASVSGSYSPANASPANGSPISAASGVSL
jgi:hypothetical protein